jgi:hypothetical protein
MIVGHDLRAVCTRSCSLLPPPPAARTNGANGQPVSDLRKKLDDPLRQSAICILEVDAAIAQTRGSEPENFGRSDRASKRQQFLCNRLGTGQECGPRLFGRSSDHADRDAAIPVRLRTRTKWRRYFNLRQDG